jgi:hypothetical protein
MRAGWILASPRKRTRVGLVRAVAAAAGLDFRELLPLDRKRRQRQALLAGFATIAAICGITFYPVLSWEDITPDGRPVYGCGTLDDGIALYRMNISQAIKNIVNVDRDVLGKSLESRPLDRSIIPRDRLLPGILPLGSEQCQGRITDWIGAPRPGLCMRLSESDEMGQIDDPMGGSEASLTEVTVGRENFVLERLWTPINLTDWENYGHNVHPSAGIPVSVSGDEIWLGFSAGDFSRGSLWYSGNGGVSWQRHPEVSDVHSVRQLAIGTLIAARKSGKLGFFILGEDQFEPFEVPGKGDDLEICGEFEKQPVLRADRRIYLRKQISQWKRLIK